MVVNGVQQRRQHTAPVEDVDYEYVQMRPISAQHEEIAGPEKTRKGR